MSKSDVVRYALVGAGGRAAMFIDPITSKFSHAAELVGLCDPNPQRLAYHQDRLTGELNYHEVALFSAEDFDRMIAETKPDVVIVTTVDGFHHEYIIRALELGCDVITEKPMTIDDEKCRAIMEAVERTGHKVRVTFNYRWTPGTTMVRRLLQEGIIGDILHVDMEYLLNTSHGADYFRRWHRNKEKSGGLMVHKSTHHFDLVNWWLDAVPETVFGMGRLAFYGRKNAEARGEKVTYDRYTGHADESDPFALRLDDDEELKAMYLDAEKHDGYRRDQNVFGEGVTIEDSMSVLVRYRTGTVLNYSLNAYLPREGYNVVFNGSKGRLEFNEVHASHIIKGQSDEELGKAMHWEPRCIVQPMFAAAYEVDVPTAEGGHGGGDASLQAQIFSEAPPAEVDGRNAGHGQGAASILIGVAANRSFKSGQPVRISDLCPQLGNAVKLSDLP